MKNNPVVSIITINYNQSEATNALLDSLAKADAQPSFEVIVVDNASGNNDHQNIDTSHSFAELVVSDINLGFAGGNNLGIRKAKGEFILLLNNDTEVEPDFLMPLIKKFRDDPSAGAVSPKIYFHHTPNMLQFTGISEMNKYTTRNTGWGYGKMDEGQFDEDRESFFAHGAAMMVPRRVIEKVGMMAEIFFLYYEEMDWGQRIRDAGYKIYYVHDSVIYHKESLSTGRQSQLKTFYMNRGRVIFIRRNVKGFNLLIACIYHNIISIPKNVIVFLLQGRFDLLKAYTKAMIWNLKNISNKEIHYNPSLKD